MILGYLCLDVAREGQASHAHVHEIIKGLTRRGVTVRLYQPYYVRNPKSPTGLYRAFGMLLAQYKICREPHFDAVYIRSHFAAAPTTALMKQRGFAVILEVNGPYDDLYIAWPWTRRYKLIFNKLMRRQFEAADAIITVTPQLKIWLMEQKVACPIHVIPNGANTDLFKPGAPLRTTLQRPYVLFFGALTRWQGITTLLSAFESEAWPPGVCLVIAGDGAERKQVELRAKRLPNIFYLGTVPYAHMPGLVANSLCAVSPKNHSGGRSDTGLYPLKVFETMACGVPIVVTDFPGQADLVRQHRCGIVVPPEDPEALALAVREISLMAPEEREQMGARGRVAVEEAHSWDRRAASTYEVLKQTVENK